VSKKRKDEHPRDSNHQWGYMIEAKRYGGGYPLRERNNTRNRQIWGEHPAEAGEGGKKKGPVQKKKTLGGGAGPNQENELGNLRSKDESSALEERTPGGVVEERGS